jgi:adenine-specific DNA glycosylase
VKENPLERRWTFVLRAGEKFLVEQRPADRTLGRHVAVRDRARRRRGFAGVVARRATELAVTAPKRLGQVSHALTHRRYEFDVYTADMLSNLRPIASGQRWARSTDCRCPSRS